MSGSNMFWFHCGRCGSLFQSHAGDSETRLCSKCGFAPGLGLQEAPAEAPPPAPEPEPEQEAGKNADGKGKRSVRKRKNRHFILKLVVGWVLVLGCIVGIARLFWSEDEAPAHPVTTAAVAEDFTDMDTELLNSAGEACMKAFYSYLGEESPEARNQFVLSPALTASRMARFYSMNPITKIDPAALALTTSAVLHFPSGNAIETQWSSKDGRTYDAVFREENGEWRLDWEHFARFSDYPWSLFLAGSGPEEGEFRLLARERLAEDRKNESTISVVLYAPRFGQPRDTGFQSPEFLISRSGKDGQLLDAAFKIARSGKRVFDSKLPDTNPDGMIRVRVKVKRSEADMERRFEISSISACHWYSLNDSGVEPSKPAEGKSTGK